jgi:hypothetical protein
VVKKKATKKTAATKAKAKAKPEPRRKADRSRIDLAPLKDHIRGRIKKLEEGGPYPETLAAGQSPEDTVKRLKDALETLSAICYPAMDIPI